MNKSTLLGAAGAAALATALISGVAWAAGPNAAEAAQLSGRDNWGFADGASMPSGRATYVVEPDGMGVHVVQLAPGQAGSPRTSLNSPQDQGNTPGGSQSTDTRD